MTDTSHTVAPDESRHYVERLSLVLSDMGFPPMPARVWAALMTSETPSSTPGDLGSRLGVSPAAISGAVRYLQQVGLIERVAVPGSRRQHYCVSVDMWADAFVTKQSSLYQVSAVADEGIRVLGEGTTAGDRMQICATSSTSWPRKCRECSRTGAPGEKTGHLAGNFRFTRNFGGVPQFSFQHGQVRCNRGVADEAVDQGREHFTDSTLRAYRFTRNL